KDEGLGKAAPVKKILTEAKDHFRFNHGIVNLESGTLKANLIRSISALSPSQATTDRLTSAIIAAINSAIVYMSLCRRWTHWAIELFISNPSHVGHGADLDRLMDKKQNNKIVYWIGRCLSMTSQEINAVGNQYRLSKRIVRDAYQALGRTTALLGPPPVGSTHVYNDLVAFIIVEYTRFFKTGDERLREQMDVDPTFMAGHTIQSFLALNNGPGQDGHGRNYPQTSFQDPYVRFTEDTLCEMLYATDDRQRRNDMAAVFGAKSACQDLVYTLFIERTRHAKTTVSMATAARSSFFKTTAADYQDKVIEYNLDPK
ncbi:hypothetical protein BGX34_007120, partial [Mortierella sp. NVP85]